MFMAILVTISLVGCSSNSTSGGGGYSSPIKIDNLKVSVEELINDGQKDVMFWFENDSKYTITYLQIRYVVKPEVTKEDIAAKYDYTLGLGDDYTVDQVFMDGIIGDQYPDTSAGDKDAVSIKPGETSPKVELHRNNVMYVRDIDEFNNMQPDVMTVRYLDKDGAEHTVYYNYSAQKYNEQE